MPDDDRMILSLSHEWDAAEDGLDAICRQSGDRDMDDDNSEFVAACDRSAEAIDAIVATPAGPRGLAAKVLLFFAHDDRVCGGALDEIEAADSRALMRSILRDAARLVPELASLATRAIDGEPAAIGFGPYEPR